MAIFSPLKPNVTYSQEDPVYWHLHRFLHWEDARRAIPRRKVRESTGSDTAAYDKSTLIGKHRLVQAFAQRVTLDDRVRDPAPIDRSKRVRSYYAKELNLPLWMDEDLVQRPSPPKGAAHPWDLNPKPSESRTMPPKEDPIILTKSDKSQLLPGNDITSNLDANRSSDQRQRPASGSNKKSSHVMLDNDRPSSAVRSADPEVPNILTRLKSRQNRSREQDLKGDHREKPKSNNDERQRSSQAEPLLPPSGTTKAKADVLAKLNGLKDSISPEEDSAETPQGARKRTHKKPPTPLKPQPKLTPHQRVLAEFRAKRRVKQKKKYIPMSKRIIKPPTTRERFDMIESDVGTDFKENANWKSLSRISTRLAQQSSQDDTQDVDNTSSVYYDTSLKRRSTSNASFAAGNLAPITNIKENKSSTKLRASLNKHAILPPIRKRQSAIETGKGAVVASARSCEVGTSTVCEVSINTDAETRHVGTSTLDDVIYIYQTVEVDKRKHKHQDRRHQHHRKNTRRQHQSSRSISSTCSSSVSSSSTSSSQHHNERKASETHNHTRRTNKKHTHSSSRSESSTSTLAGRRSSTLAAATSPPPVQTCRDHHDQRNTDDISYHHKNFKAAEKEKLPKTAKSGSRKHHLASLTRKNIKHHGKNTDDGGDKASDVNKTAIEKMLSFTVRSWSGRTKRVTYTSEDLEGKSTEDVRNQILNEMGIPKDMVQVTTVKSRDGSDTARRRSSFGETGYVEDLRKQRTIETKLRRMGSHLSSADSVKSPNVPSSQSDKKQPLSKTASLPLGTVISSGAAPLSRQQKRQQMTAKIVEEEVSEQDEHTTATESSKPASRVSSRPNMSKHSSRRSSVPQVVIEPATPQKEDMEESEECRYCSRKFTMARLEIHEAACFKTKRYDAMRKVFDSRKARLSTIMANAADRMVLENGNDGQKKQKSKPSLWRERHKAFLEQIRYAKKVTEVEKAGGDISALGPAPKTVIADDLTPCPKCGRKFNVDAIKRHVPVCKAEPIARRK